MRDSVWRKDGCVPDKVGFKMERGGGGGGKQLKWDTQLDTRP